MKDQNASPGRRAASYWFADGFPDLLLAATLGVFALAAWVWRSYAPEPARKAYFLIVAAGFLLHFAYERPVLDWLKSRFTYPRTGYVQPPEEAEPRPRSLISLSLNAAAEGSRTNENVTWFRNRTVMLIFWVFFAVRDDMLGQWLAAAAMPVLAILLYAVNRKSERPYPWWPAVILALMGLPFRWLSTPTFPQPLLVILLTSAWLAAVGCCTRIAYLHANPAGAAVATKGVEA